MGDLNAKMISSGKFFNKNGVILEELLLENDIIVLNNSEHTHYDRADSSSILDYIICSSELYQFFDYYKVLVNHDMTSDLVPIMANFIFKTYFKDNNITNANSQLKNYKFNYNKANWTKYKISLPTIIPNDIEYNLNLFDEFVTSSMINAAKVSIPQYCHTKFNKSLPKYILELIESRKLIRKKIRKNKSIELKPQYNLLTKLIRDEIKAIKNNNWKSFIDSMGPNPINTKPFLELIKN